jgi:hypothetical protein
MATTYNDQLTSLIASTNSLIYPNNNGLITGQVHQDNENVQNNSAFDNLVAYDNYNYKVVRTTDIPLDNGQALRDAYADAATFTGLSATNRFALLLPPGTYALGVTGLDVDTEFIDFVGLGQAGDVIITSTSNTNSSVGTITQTADDVRYKNLTITNAAATNTSSPTDDSGYAPAGSASNTVMEDVIFLTEDGGAPFMRREVEYSGTYVRCKGIDQTLTGYISVLFQEATGTFTDCETNTSGFGVQYAANGVFTRCKALENSFGSSFGDCDGTFTDCVVENGGSFGYLTNNVKGKFYNCRAGFDSFGGSNASAVYVNCVAGANSFYGLNLAGSYSNCNAGNGSFNYSSAPILSGTFQNCNAGDYSFGGAFSVLSGTFKNCNAGDYSFGTVRGSELSGTFMSCSAGNESFGYSAILANPTQISGYFSDCRAGNQSFGTLYASVTDDARFYDCVGGNGCWSFSSGPATGVQMYNCQAEGGMNFSTTADAIIKNCVALRGGFLNGSPGVMAGVYIDCYTESGFGVGAPSSIVLSGIFKNCHTIGSGFGSGSGDVTLSGIFVGCSSDSNSFGYSSGATAAILISGKFFNCIAKDDSFGCSNGNSATVLFTGSAYNCKAENHSFCTTLGNALSGNSEIISSDAILQDCKAGEKSFAGQASSEKRGSFIRCYCINSDTDEGILFGPTGYMEDCTWIAQGASKPAFLIQEDGTKIYGGIYKAGPGASESISAVSGSWDAKIIGIKMNAQIDGSIFNLALTNSTDAAGNIEYTAL